VSRLHFLFRLLEQPTPVHLLELAGFVLVGLAGLWLLTRISPTYLVAGGVGAEIFSGNWKYMGITVPFDRLLLLLGLLSMLIGGRRMLAQRRIVWRPVHLLVLVVAAWATCSAIWAGTVATHAGFYALLDRLGFIPFLAFTLAPLLFGTRDKRNVLLAVLVIVGVYLGTVAIMEGAGLERYVEPAYIRNPAIGILYGRARGPFVEAVADGLGLFFCAVAAAIGLVEWRRLAWRRCCYYVLATCLVGSIFTLTRAIWLGVAGGVVAGLIAYPGTRRHAWKLLAVGGGVVSACVFLIPGLHHKVVKRALSSSSVWDRLNTDHAALAATRQHPLFGIGWQTFQVKGPDYLHEALTYPLTGAGLEVHNVFLSHAVELGIPGSILWTAALFTAVGGALLRRSRPEMYAWRAGLLAIFVCFLIVANVGPLSYAFPNLVLWVMAGTVGYQHLSSPLAVRPAAGATMQLLDETAPLPVVASG
jgi:putative inorganic carbon (HCO3(-)) transporter